MKKYLLFPLILLGFINLSAQSIYNRSYHSQNEISNPFLVEINNSIYFSTTQVDHSQIPYLYKHNNAGVLKFKDSLHHVPKYGYRTKDNMLLLIGRDPLCDVLWPTQVNYINKIDTNGNSVFLSTYTVTQSDNYIASLQYSDSSYYSFTDSVLFKNSKTGLFISKTNLGIHSISSALLLQNNTILLSAKQGTISSLIVISSSGNILISKPFPVLLTKLGFYGGQNIIGLGANGLLYKVSANLNSIGTSAFATNLSVTNFTCKNDTIYSLLTSNTVLSNYCITDTTFNNITFSSTSTQKITQTAICLNGSRVAILSTGISKSSSSWPGEHYFASLNQINKFSGNNFTHDVTLISVISDSSFASVYQNNGTSCLRAKVIVKNTGTTIINDFKLNCYMSPRVDCGGYYYQQKFSNLSIQPGDSATFTTNTFINKPILMFTIPTATVQYCFYTTLPNGETDKVFAGNELCKAFVFNTNTTSIKEFGGVAQNISVAPNPFETILSIESESEIKKVDIYSTLGALISTIIVNERHVNINNQDLIPGIYFIKIDTEKGTQIKKVIKQ